MKKTLFSLIVVLTSACEVMSQAPAASDSSEAADSTAYTLAPVLVSATRSTQETDRLPYAVDVLFAQDIQRAEAGLSLEEALRSVAGAVVNNRHNLSQGDRVTIRGIGSRTPFGVRGLKIILDGIPLTMPDGQSQLNNLDLASAGKIEILRGPSSALYGNAAGGVINIQTEPAQNAPVSVQPQFITGSYDLQKWQAKLSGTIGKQSYLVNANKLLLTGHREHAEAKATALNVVSRHELSRHMSATALFNYFDAPYLLNPSSLSKAEVETSPTATRFFVKQQGAGKNTTQGQIGITLRYHAGDDTQLETTVYGLWRALLNPIPGRIIDLDRAAGGVRTVFNRQLQFGSSVVRSTFGVDFEAQYDTRLEFQNQGIPPAQAGVIEPNDIFSALQYGPALLDQKEQVIGFGPFAELQWQINIDWLLTLGARYDSYRLKAEDRFFADGADDSGARNLQQLSPMIGLVYRLGPVLAAYANYATAFQIPTTTELSNRPEGEGGFNPGLQPERMRSIEIGLKGSFPENRLNYDLALYRIDIEDMLISYQIQNSASEEVFFRNAGKTGTTGVEAALRWRPVPGLRASLAYTWMDFEFEDFVLETSSEAGDSSMQLAGNKVPGVPPQRFFAGVIYEHGSGAFAELNWQQMDQYFTNDFNGPPPASAKPLQDFINEAYQVTDVRLGWQSQFKNMRGGIFGGVNNLFEERYSGSIVPNAAADRFFEPAPVRTWYAGINVAIFSK